MFSFIWLTYLIIMTHNGSQTGKSTLVPHLCSPIHGTASYKGTIMVEQAVAYFFWMTSEDTYSTANSTTYIQVHWTFKYIKLIVCLCDGVGLGSWVCACMSMNGEHLAWFWPNLYHAISCNIPKMTSIHKFHEDLIGWCQLFGVTVTL